MNIRVSISKSRFFREPGQTAAADLFRINLQFFIKIKRNIMDNDKKKKYRRYRLHRKIKGVYRYEFRSKIIYVPNTDDLTNKYLRELYENYNYSIQFEIPS
jgi:hypothetical protein